MEPLICDPPSKSNPFLETKTNEPVLLRAFKLLFGAAVLVPFKFVTLLILTVTMASLFRIANLFLKFEEAHLTTSWWRVAVLKPVPFLSRICLFIFGYFKVSRKGIKCNDPRVAPIIVSNHVSGVDQLIMLHEFMPCYFSKLQNKNQPFFSWILIATRSIFVDRTSPESKEQVKQQILDRANLCYKYGVPMSLLGQLLIFPEGTTTDGSTLLKFRTGAFQPGLPVAPIILKYPFKNFNVASFHDRSIASSTFEMMCQFTNEIEITYLPVYTPSKEEREDPILYANNVRKYMSAQSGLPMSPYGNEDVIRLVDKKQLEAVGSHLIAKY